MHNEMKGLRKFFGLIVISLSFLIIPTILYGGATDKKNESPSITPGKYILKVKGNQISLKARDASLMDILLEIGRRMNIKVTALIPREEKITIDLDMQYLGDAIKKFKTNYAYITASEKEKGKISRIVALPEGNEKAPPEKYEYNPQPPLQNFEQKSQPPVQRHRYNPQPPVQNYDKKPQPTPVKPDDKGQSSSPATENESQSGYKSNVNEPKTSDVGSGNTVQSPDVNSENNAQPSDVGSESTPQTPDAGSENTPQTPDVGSGYNPQPPMQ